MKTLAIARIAAVAHLHLQGTASSACENFSCFAIAAFIHSFASKMNSRLVVRHLVVNDMWSIVVFFFFSFVRDVLCDSCAFGCQEVKSPPLDANKTFKNYCQT